MLYVDDILPKTSFPKLYQRITSILANELAMTDLGNLNYFLGIVVTRDSKGMFLSHHKYVLEILDHA